MTYFDAEAASTEVYSGERKPVDVEAPYNHYLQYLAVGKTVSLRQVCLEEAQTADPLTAAVYERIARYF